MRELCSAALVAAMLLCCHAAASGTGSEERDFAVVGYVPEYRSGGLDWENVAPHYTHLVFFSVEVDELGQIVARDRLPPPDVLERAHAARATHGTKLMLSIGGFGRTNGFPFVAQRRKVRRSFIHKQLVPLMQELDLDGFDSNWEYPESRAEWRGLFAMLKETRAAFDELDGDTGRRREISMAFYPGQEDMIATSHDAMESVDIFHMMSYDQPRQHSTMGWVKRVVNRARAASPFPYSKMTLGLPFYGRDTRTGEAATYGDIVRDHPSLKEDADEAGTQSFNGPATISAKVEHAWDQGLAGVMVWEAGQDAAPDHPRSLARVISETVVKLRQRDADRAREDWEL